MTLLTKILAVLIQDNGLSDREIREALGVRHHSQINQECRLLQSRGYIVRKRDGEGPIRNFLIQLRPQPQLTLVSSQP